MKSSSVLSKARPSPMHRSPLQQNPVTPIQASNPSDATTQTLILSHPSARLSSSPASSPRIIDSPPTRRRSVRPEMSGLMDRGMSPGVDFFEDSSGEEDDSEWEDDNGTRDFSEAEGQGITTSVIVTDDEEEEEVEEKRGRPRGDTSLTALPLFNQLPAHDSGTGTGNDEPATPIEKQRPKKARQMSLRRIGKGKIVHNNGSGSAGNGTPRESLVSNDSSLGEPLPDSPKQFSEMIGGNDAGVALSNPFKGRHRRNTSESIRADSIINAHVITIRDLESLSSTASFSLSRGRSLSFSNAQHSNNFFKSPSFTEQRHIMLPPILTTISKEDPDRPAHLPNHFIKTPYPFTAKKEFPKPETRPRHHVFDNGEEIEQDGLENKKGKHILGIVASDGEFDLRSRLERNEDAQGVIRSRSDAVGRKRKWDESSARKHDAREESVWLSLRRRNRNDDDVVNRLERVVVPSNLTTTIPDQTWKKMRKNKGKVGSGAKARGNGEVTIDFDDHFFAGRLRKGYRNLAGPWILCTLSAKKLRCIRLGQANTWSGSDLSSKPYQALEGSGTKRLLAAGGGVDIDMDTRSPFTEHNLMSLYQNPKSGKARYTWVHWARRVAASNNTTEPSFPARATTNTRFSSRRRAKSLDSPQGYEEKTIETLTPQSHRSSQTLPDSITTIQFVHAFSPLKICLALVTMLALSVIAAVLWIFFGESAWALPDKRGKSERVGSGMLVGLLLLVIEGVIFFAWLWASRAWL